MRRFNRWWHFSAIKLASRHFTPSMSWHVVDNCFTQTTLESCRMSLDSKSDFSSLRMDKAHSIAFRIFRTNIWRKIRILSAQRRRRRNVTQKWQFHISAISLYVATNRQWKSCHFSAENIRLPKMSSNYHYLFLLVLSYLTEFSRRWVTDGEENYFHLSANNCSRQRHNVLMLVSNFNRITVFWFSLVSFPFRLDFGSLCCGRRWRQRDKLKTRIICEQKTNNKLTTLVLRFHLGYMPKTELFSIARAHPISKDSRH